MKALPDDLEDVAVSVIDSFVSIWDSFIAHTPYIPGAIIVHGPVSRSDSV